jgi:hypothetical protein
MTCTAGILKNSHPIPPETSHSRKHIDNFPQQAELPYPHTQLLRGTTVSTSFRKAPKPRAPATPVSTPGEQKSCAITATMPPKRSASTSSTEERPSKKQKMTQISTPVTPAAEFPVAETPEGESPETSSKITIVEQPKPLRQEDTGEIVDAPNSSDVNASFVKHAKATRVKAVRKKPPPVREAFVPLETKPTVTIPAASPFWGIKPVSGDPRPHANQPSARDSNGATNPPMWEDRKFRYKRGSRYVTYFGPIKPEGADDDDAEQLDQEDLLLMTLMDMRPKSKHDQTPRRMPTFYCFDAGTPKDWNDMQSIKCLNDRRGQAIDRLTLDAPWQPIEREYLVRLLMENPDASIWELTELHNDHFMGKEFVGSTGFNFNQLSLGRTVESVRHEYVTYKPAYDSGEAPGGIRFRVDRSLAGKALTASKRMEKAFGPASKKLAKNFDDAAGSGDEDGGSDGESGDECGEKTPKPAKKTPKKAIPKRKKKSPTNKSQVIVNSENEGEQQVEAATRMAQQPKLAEDDEELLTLAGLDDPEQIRSSPSPAPRSRTPSPSPSRRFYTGRPRALSFSSGSDLSDPPSDLESPTASQKRKAITAPAPVPKKRVRTVSPFAISEAPSEAESPGAADYEAALATIEKEAVSAIIASQQPEPEALVIKQAVVTKKIMETVIEQAVAVEQPVTPAATPEAKVTPSPRALRDVEIDDNYDDDEVVEESQVEDNKELESAVCEEESELDDDDEL